MPHISGKFLGLAGAMALALILSPRDVAAQSLCEIYTVKPGDTLAEIARAARVRGGYQILFDANSDTLSSPNRIEVGARLRIPCADGTLPGRAPVVAAAAAQAVKPPAPAPAPAAEAPKPLPPIRFLTAGAYAPFTDESLPEQGLFTELVKTAVTRSGADLDHRVTFVNDWGSHLTDLLPSGAFDMGFPWYLPDCSRVENLSAGNALRCTDYDASDPFFEAVVSFYTLRGSQYETVSAYPQLLGARLCRPDGWFTFDLEAERLTPPNVEMLVAPTQVGCWNALMEGKVDVVTFDALPAEADIDALGLRDRVVEMPALSTLATMHVFTPKSNPNGRAYLDALNTGVAEMRRTGEWFSIVARHLSDQPAPAADVN